MGGRRMKGGKRRRKKHQYGVKFRSLFISKFKSLSKYDFHKFKEK